MTDRGDDDRTNSEFDRGDSNNPGGREESYSRGDTNSEEGRRPSVAQRFMALFAGNENASGTHGEPYQEPGSPKWQIKRNAKTLRQPVTEASWEQHLKGVRPLGVIPICSDDTCSWGSIDVDEYELDLLPLIERVEKEKLPLVPCRSKSGGLHLFLFASEPVPAKQMSAALRAIASRLGLADVEIFPKQEKLDANECGNWIVMPYCGTTFGGKLRDQVGLRRNGSEMRPGEFLDLAESRRVNREHLAQLTRARRRHSGDADGASYAERALDRYCKELADTAEGGRNNKLNMAAHEMGRMIGAGWIEGSRVEEELTRAAANCGLPADETKETIKRAIADGMRKGPPEIGDAGDLVTEDSAALEFAARHDGTLLFDHDAGSWFRWSGSHWAEDRTQLAFSWARSTVREIAASEKARVRYVTSKASFAGAVERFAKADRAFAVRSEIWDRDPFLLGTPGGTVDLRDGALRPARCDDHITKLAAVAPAAEADCPRWLKFLGETTSDNPETARFLQRLCGYALTGDTREHLLAFVYGPGGNGKSVFVNTIAGILGEYATAAAMETFTASKSGRHPTDLAMLRGARLVTAFESEQGQYWAESRIKQLTGGDPITARFMRQDFFTYTPAFKLLIVGNHQPSLQNVTEAARRRFAIVPFVYRPADPDRELERKLKAEWSGILRWMIDGCLEWQEKGLPRPDVVQEATESYFEEQDLFGQWLAQYIEPIPAGPGAKATASAVLFASWRSFAIASGEEPGSKKAFGEAMKQRGYTPGKAAQGGGRVWLGIRLQREFV